MGNRVILILTEGDHDAAFIYRILKSKEFKTVSYKIKDFPAPLDRLFTTDINQVSISDIKLEEAKTRFLPKYAMEQDNNMILLYSIGGESKSESRIKLINVFKELNNAEEDEIQADDTFKFSALYFLDADEHGTQLRLNSINTELRQIFDGQVTLAQSEAIVDLNGTKIGVYVFKEEDTDQGKLEDVLLPLMRDGNIDIFDKAEAFLSIHADTNLFKERLKYSASGALTKVNDMKYCAKKSLIGVVGQLQKSGKSNTVCISDSDFLTIEKINNNSECQRIFNFIQASYQ